MEEMLAITSVKQATEEFSAADLAWDIAEIVDPTGVASLTRYIVEGHDECVYPTGPSASEQRDLTEAQKANFEASCGSTAHGGYRYRYRYKNREEHNCRRERQSSQCSHGSWLGYSGSYSQTMCRTKRRSTYTADCKRGCKGGWRHYGTGHHGCCSAWYSC